MAGSRKARPTVRPRKRRAALAPARAAGTGLRQQLAEARAQQAATAEILKVIARSPGDEQPVLDAIGRLAERLCKADVSVVSRFDGERLQLSALHGVAKRGMERVRRVFPMALDAETVSARAFRGGKVVHVPDVLADRRYGAKGTARVGGWRGALGVPMLREGKVIGVIFVARFVPGLFSEAQVGLLSTFADQAVIAIENVRLFNETREALERQTATAEILKVIARSPSDVQPVFEAIADNAKRLLGGFSGMVLRYDGELLHLCTVHSERKDQARFMSNFFPVSPVGEPLSGRCVLERAIIQTPDLRLESDPRLREIASGTGVRAVLVVPMLRDGAPIGTISVARIHPGAFSLAETELLTTFADQAVIAIENVRLFKETREALERQTATAEILKVIAGSPADVQPVFEAIVRNFVGLSGGLFGAVFRFDGNLVHFASAHGFTEAQSKAIRAKYPVAPDDPSVISSRAILTRAPVVIEDIAQDRFYDREHAYVAGWRRIIAVPMLREGVPLGAIVSAWTEPGPIPQPLQDLLETFADQAVIAIENVRLFNETREALERQTATAEVLNVIAGSPSSVQPVFDVIAKSAYRLLGGFSTAVARVFDDVLHLVAFSSTDEAGNEALKHAFPMPVSRSKAARTGEAVSIRDTEALPESASAMRDLARTRGFRSILIVPMLRDGAAIGTISVTRREPADFTKHQVDLLKTFADQAVIAIENVRLFNETKEALERQTATAEVLKVIASSPSDVQPVFDIIAERAVALSGAHDGVVTRFDGQLVHFAAMHKVHPEGADAIRSAFPCTLDQNSAGPRAIRTSQVVHLPDVREIPDYYLAKAVDAGGVCRMLAVPLLREGKAMGAITLAHKEPGYFSDHVVELLKTFADQAVIAIENVRLFNDTREALERQTATAEILKAIASSPSDVQPVFDAIASSAARLFGSRAGILVREGDRIDLKAAAAVDSTPETDREAFAAMKTRYPIPFDPETVFAARVMAGVQSVVVPDTEAPGVPERARELGRLGRYRSFAMMPLLREGGSIGVLAVTFAQAGVLLTANQLDLLRTFADQAVIAIENVRLFNETKEALEQQRASADVLGAISGSITDTRPVFDKILDRCEKLFEGNVVGITLATADGKIDLAAYHGRDYEKLKGVYPLPLSRESGSGAAILEATVAHYPDIEADGVPPGVVAGCRTVGMRAIIFAPMLFEGRGIGAIWVGRMNAGMFTQKQIALLRTFTDQAVIAIQNVRMFNETREALERQTATAEILKVIAGSPSDVQPVFDAIAQSATRLLGGFSTAVIRVEGDKAQLAAFTSTGQSGDDALRAVFPVTVSQAPGNVGRAMREKVAQWTEDVEAETSMPEDFRAAIRARGWRSGLAVPMVRQGEVIGAINVTRREPGRFSAHQIGLLTTFADQAVIAIENVRLFNETKEALERQTATSSVLREISRSTFDLDAILRTLLDNAMRLCGAVNCAMFLKGADGSFRFASQVGYVPDSPLERVLRDNPIRPEPDTTTGRALLERRTVHTHDIRAEQGYRPDLVALAEYRTNLAVPMLRDGEVMGAITLTRGKDVNPFTDKQIELVEGFSAQAVIAIENVRLFNETKEALERQTATAEILKVISSSPTDVQPVFEAIVESGMKLFSGAGVGIGIVSGREVVIEAAAGMGGVGRGFRMPLSRDSASGMAILERKLVNIADTEAPGVPSHARENGRRLGIRSMTQAPMFREGEPIGSIGVMLREPGGLDDKQLALLRTFADQAVIAIENVRLFNETKEALERQTATAEILKVIASSPSDVQPVFDAIVRSAERLFGRRAALRIAEPAGLRLRARSEGIRAETVKEVMPIDDESLVGQVALLGKAVQFSDLRGPDAPPFARKHAHTWNFRANAGAPLIRDGKTIGVITVTSPETGAMTEKQMELLATFADQAVIAIENVRLFKELESRTRALTKSVGQLTALGEVGQAISSTLDLETVLQTIVSRAVQLTGMDAGSIYEYDEQAEVYRLKAAEKMAPELVEAVRQTPIRKGDGATGRTAVTREPVQAADIQDASYQGSRKDNLMRTGYRAVLAVPLLREDHLLGALQVFRRAPGAFAPEVVELLKTFATQSAMAIQNARLFREIADKGRQLEEASRHKSDFLASMSHELRTPLNAILGFNEMILGQVYGEVPADMKEPLEDIQKSGKHLLRLINNVLDLAKIEAGRMELSVQEYSVQDTVESVRATLRPLATEKGLAFVAGVPGDLPLARGDSGRIAQCLMNLAGNSLKFTKAGKVEINVTLEGDRLHFSVADTGIGIPADKIGGLFTEFKQTDASIASEYGGTGLGLSITKKFIEMHGGRIWVESEPGRGSTFRFEVPLRVSA